MPKVKSPRFVRHVKAKEVATIKHAPHAAKMHMSRSKHRKLTGKGNKHLYGR